MTREDALKDFNMNSIYHASSFVLSLIRLIEDDIIYTLGIVKNLKMFVYVDDTQVIFVVSNEDNDIIHDVKYQNTIKHYFTNKTYAEITLDLKCLISEKYKLDLREASAVFIEDEEWRASDDGEIFIEGNVNLSLYTLKDFLIDIFSRLTRELQYCINFIWKREMSELYSYCFKDLNDNLFMEKQVKNFIEEIKKIYV